MSDKYKHGDRVPTDVLADRLDELADVVTKGSGAVNREFTMRVPAEMDRDADLVLSEAARQLRELSQPTEHSKAARIGKRVGVLVQNGKGEVAAVTDLGRVTWLPGSAMGPQPTQQERTESTAQWLAKHGNDFIGQKTPGIPGQERTCRWEEDGDGTYFTRCGEAHQFTNNGIKENGHVFCAYCGGKIVEDN